MEPINNAIFLLQIIIYIHFIFASTDENNANKILRIMTFNTWYSGKKVDDGLAKIAKHVALVNPDIVTFQEITSSEVIANLTNLLGSQTWKVAYSEDAKRPNVAIFTRHKFVENRFAVLNFSYDELDYPFAEGPFNSTLAARNFAIGATIEMPITTDQNSNNLIRTDQKKRINVFNLHLEYRSYGPYAANNKLVTHFEQIEAGENCPGRHCRVQNVQRLFEHPLFKQFMQESTDSSPFIIAGDLNTPSHLDWIDETRALHGNWTFEWPTTKMLADAGFVDSFRHLHADPGSEPGITWSTILKFKGPEWDWQIPEPQDRIDFIFYKSPSIVPTNSYTYAGQSKIEAAPNFGNNDWPSDHYAVITEFSV